MVESVFRELVWYQRGAAARGEPQSISQVPERVPGEELVSLGVVSFLVENPRVSLRFGEGGIPIVTAMQNAAQDQSLASSILHWLSPIPFS